MTFDLKFQLSFNMASKGSVGIYVPSNYRAWFVRSHSNLHEEYNAPGCPLGAELFFCVATVIEHSCNLLFVMSTAH